MDNQGQKLLLIQWHECNCLVFSTGKTKNIKMGRQLRTSVSLRQQSWMTQIPFKCLFFYFVYFFLTGSQTSRTMSTWHHSFFPLVAAGLKTNSGSLAQTRPCQPMRLCHFIFIYFLYVVPFQFSLFLFSGLTTPHPLQKNKKLDS